MEFAQNNLVLFQSDNFAGAVAPPGSFFEPKFKKEFEYDGDITIKKTVKGPTLNAYVLLFLN